VSQTKIVGIGVAIWNKVWRHSNRQTDTRHSVCTETKHSNQYTSDYWFSKYSFNVCL